MGGCIRCDTAIRLRAHARQGRRHSDLPVRPERMSDPFRQALGIVAPLLMMASAIAAPSGTTDVCIGRDVKFDGITPLRYADVTGESGSRVYLHAVFPSHCSSSEGESCSTGPYIVPGDAVAVGKTCGDWSYVQYIGADRITVGWTAASALTELPTPPPISPPVTRDHDTAQLAKNDHTERYRFQLAEGRGIPVCDAYLQRLNETEYWGPPYCGRPEDSRVPGFSRLHRVYLTGAETAQLYPHLQSFGNARDSSHPPVLGATEARLAASGGSGPGIIAWRYDPKVDIENDGRPDNVVIWVGPPLDVDADACGNTVTSSGTELSAGLRVEQIGLISSDPDTRTLDDARTLAVFGSPHGAAVVSGSLGFVPVGSSISVFVYRSVTYFDTFFHGEGWPDFYGNRARVPALDNHLAVFLRRDGVTRQICEYIFHDHHRPRALRHDTEAQSHE